MTLARSISQLLKERGIRYFVTVANGEWAPLYFELADDPDFTVITACREGEAIAIAAGLELAGERSIVSMENFGLFECLDTLRALHVDMGIRLTLLIGYTGRPKPEREALIEQRLGNIGPQVLVAGDWTEPALALAGISCHVIDAPDDSALPTFTRALAEPGRTAVLIESMG